MVDMSILHFPVYAFPKISRKNVKSRRERFQRKTSVFYVFARGFSYSSERKFIGIHLWLQYTYMIQDRNFSVKEKK